MSVRSLLPFLLVLAVLASGCGGGEGAAEATTDDIATVGSIHLTKARFVDEIARARASLKLQKQKFPKEGTTEYEQLKSQAIWLLVLEAARELEAKKLGIEVTDEQVTAYLDNIKKTSFGNDDAQLEKELKKEGLTMAEARHLIRGRLISDQLTTHITEDVKVSDDAVHDYFVENKAQYPPEREIQYILVGKNKEKLANEIYAKLKGGAKFAALAKQYSQDDSSKNSGGKLTAKKGQLVPKFEEVAFALKAGELSKPVNTPEYGWFVIKALKPVKKPTEKDVAETIRAQLLQERSNEAMTEWASDLAQDICTGDKISYQIGYTPNPDPCAQYAPAPTP
jgi:foldase protein PrsA